MELTSTESAFVECVVEGKIFDAAKFVDEPGFDREIRAEVLRSLLLGCNRGRDANGDETAHSRRLTGYGIRVCNAVIAGRLNLSGLGTGEDCGLPPIHLLDTRLIGGLDACGASIAELRLDGCEYAAVINAGVDDAAVDPVHLDSARIEGALTLSRLRAEESGRPCWVSARDITVDGPVKINNAKLYRPAREKRPRSKLLRFALDLVGANIGRDFSSLCGLECDGGIGLVRARVGGDAWLLGANVSGGEGSAVNAQGLSLAGGLIIRPVNDTTDDPVNESTLAGDLRLYGADIRGGIYLAGTTILAHPYADTPGISSVSVNLAAAKVGLRVDASLWNDERGEIRQFNCLGAFEMRNAVVDGDVAIQGADIGSTTNDTGAELSIIANNIQVTGSLNITAASSEGQIFRTSTEGAILLNSASIGHDVNISRVIVGTEASSLFLCKRMHVGGSLAVQDLKVTDGLSFADASIDGSAHIAAHRPTRESLSKPSFIDVSVAGIRVGRTAYLAADCAALDFFMANIGGATAIEAVVTGNASLAMTQIAGDLSLRKFHFQKPADARTNTHRHTLLAKDVKVSGNLQIAIPTTDHLADLAVTDAWSCELGCYPGIRYFEAEVRRADGTWYASFLQSLNTDAEYDGVYICNGRSSIFHQLNESRLLDITTEDNAKEYLRLFCASTWADEGAFVIAEQARGLPLDRIDLTEHPQSADFDPDRIVPIEVLAADTPVTDSDGDKRKQPKNEEYLMRAFVRYANGLFEAYFSLRVDGTIEMIKNDLKLLFSEEIKPEFRPPLRKRSDYFTRESYFVTDRCDGLQQLAKKDLADIRSDMEALITIELQPHNFRNADIDLRDAAVSGLNDDDGAGWGTDVTLKLLNFRYERFSVGESPADDPPTLQRRMQRRAMIWLARLIQMVSSGLSGMRLKSMATGLRQSRFALAPPPFKSRALRSRIQRRLDWLELQFPKYGKKTLRRRWHNTVTRLLPSKRRRVPRRFVSHLFEPQPYSQAAAVFRREGASELAREIDYVKRRMTGRKYAKYTGVRRPIALFAHFLYGISSNFGLSPIRTLAWILAAIIVGGFTTNVANHKGLLISASSAEARLCGKDIEPLLYATDVFIPLIDLKQESRCVLRTVSNSRPAVVDSRLASSSSRIDQWTMFVADALSEDLQTWYWIRFVYTVLGWVMISLFIYTLTHKLRSQDT